MLVAVAKILVIKEGTSIDQPNCQISPPALFYTRYYRTEIEVEFLQTNMP
jgi:hypothetical protein